MSAKMRARKYRKRQRLGVQVVSVEVDQDMTEVLVARGFLDRERVGDAEAISDALKRMSSRLVTCYPR